MELLWEKANLDDLLDYPRPHRSLGSQSCGSTLSWPDHCSCLALAPTSSHITAVLSPQVLFLHQPLDSSSRFLIELIVGFVLSFPNINNVTFIMWSKSPSGFPTLLEYRSRPAQPSLNCPASLCDFIPCHQSQGPVCLSQSPVQCLRRAGHGSSSLRAHPWHRCGHMLCAHQCHLSEALSTHSWLLTLIPPPNFITSAILSFGSLDIVSLPQQYVSSLMTSINNEYISEWVASISFIDSANCEMLCFWVEFPGS